MTNSQKYEYKNSGIEWIGKIPKHLQLIKNKYFIKYIKGKNPNNLNSHEEGIPYIGASELDNILGESIYENYTKDLNLPIANKDDILILWDGARAGLIGFNHYGAISSTIVKLKIDKNKIDAKFLFYYLKGFEKFLCDMVNGTTIPHMNKLYIEQIYFLSFPIKEQQQIAFYLDKKCENIDNVIEKTKKQIELLKEYKLSVITETVTKGLDKSVELKDSGIKWIGKIPKHWETIAIKRVVKNLICGIAATPDYVSESEGVLFLSAQNIQNGKIDLSTKSYIPVHLHKKLTRKIKPKRGDILQVRVGATIGNVAIVDIEEEFSIYVSLTLIQVNKTILNRYLKYYLSTNSFRRNAELFVDFAGTQGNLNVFDLKNMKIPFPPLSEQQLIAEYLDKKCSQIDETIEKKEQLIEKLTEYKKSLIYECVTGKKQIV